MGILKAVDLHRITSEAGLFASTDATLPAIGVVKFEVSADAILAVATDRFSLGASRANYESNGEDWSFELHPAEWKRLVAATKTPKRDAEWRTVEIKRGENGIVIFRFNDGNEQHIREAEPGFPKAWRNFFPTVEQVDQFDPKNHKSVGYTPALLARFAKVAGKSMRITPCYGPNGWKASTVRMRDGDGSNAEIRDDFVAILMPVNLDHCNDDYRQSLPVWL